MLRVFAWVLAAKAYLLVLLVVLFCRQDLRPDYRLFIFRDLGETRPDRLVEIRGDFFERLAPFDGQFYLDIAHRGYRRMDRMPANGESVPQGNYAFFPLLPCLIKVASALPWSEAASIVVLNILLSSLGLLGVWLIACELAIPPWQPVLLMLAFPTAVFQAAVYTEGLFLFLSVTAYRLSRSSRAGLGASVAALCGACRPQGVLVGALFLGSALRRVEQRTPQPGEGRRTSALLAVGAPLLGVAAFSALLALSIGDPLGFLSIQREWHRGAEPAGILEAVASFWSYQGPPFDRIAFVFGVALLPYLWRRLPMELAVYATATVLMPLLTGNLLSLGRFLSVSFPHFLGLAKLCADWPVVRLLLLVLFLFLQTLLARGLVAWQFVG